jgi:hypothetical protein
MERELVFEARAMLAEVVADQYPAVAEALLDGVLDGDRFFVMSSTLEAFASDGRDAAEVASVERRLVELARVMPDGGELLVAAWAAARVLTRAARQGLDDQWRMAAQMSEVAAAGGDPLLVRASAHEGPWTAASNRADQAPADRGVADRGVADRGVADRDVSDDAAVGMSAGPEAGEGVHPASGARALRRGAVRTRARPGGQTDSSRRTRTSPRTRPGAGAPPWRPGGVAARARSGPVLVSGGRTRCGGAGRGPPPRSAGTGRRRSGPHHGASTDARAALRAGHAQSNPDSPSSG